MSKNKPAKPMPQVIIEVTGGVAECTLVVRGEGTPQVYIWDWDNIKSGDSPPDIPEWVLNEYAERHKFRLEP